MLLYFFLYYIYRVLCDCCCVQAAASSAVESLIDMQGCLVVIFTSSRWGQQERGGEGHPGPALPLSLGTIKPTCISTLHHYLGMVL
jgi:hypothetical protein